MKCGIIPRSAWPSCTNTIKQILEQQDCTVVIPNEEIHQSDIFDMHDLDVIIPIGGDGTVLATINGLRNTDIPIFGVHAGTLGFLTNVVPDEFEVAFNHWSTHGKPSIIKSY
ncbi:MAG: NAD(+)/NADH kinase [Methanosarcina sp.]|nr:NAD(+)/NADH kinase [Methanosarcina sp.]